MQSPWTERYMESKARFWGFSNGRHEGAMRILWWSEGKVHRREKNGERRRIERDVLESWRRISEDFWRKAQTKREKTNCNQGCPGMLLVTLEIITRVRFLRVFSFQNIWCSVVWCGRKGPQIVLLILIAYLFASNLFMIFPTSLSPLKNHETWLYLIFFLLFLFILSPLPRFSTIHVLNHSSWFPGGCLQTFHMSGNLERIRIERTRCFIQRKSIQKLSFIPTRNWFWNWSIMVE